MKNTVEEHWVIRETREAKKVWGGMGVKVRRGLNMFNAGGKKPVKIKRFQMKKRQGSFHPGSQKGRSTPKVSPSNPLVSVSEPLCPL